MVGMIVPQETRDPAKPQEKVIPGMQEALALAMNYYRAELKKSPRAIDYLKGRGLSGQVAARFQIGYAPAGWQNLQTVFEHYDNEMLETIGLTVKNEQGKRYDRFRDRIMFPIHDQKGQVIGFGACGHAAVFDFDEVADMHVVGKLRCRTQAREGSDYAVSADLRVIDDGKWRDSGAARDGCIANDAVGADCYALAQAVITLKNAIDVDAYVATAIQGTAQIETAFIDPGKPWQNGTDESFNDKFRDECLTIEWFRNRLEAQVGIERWRRHYNEERPHSSLGYRIPSKFASQCAASVSLVLILHQVAQRLLSQPPIENSLVRHRFQTTF